MSICDDLLASQYDVEAVPDGEVAFQSALARLPDLVVTDVMMPKLDGFGLLKALRADAAHGNRSGHAAFGTGGRRIPAGRNCGWR